MTALIDSAASALQFVSRAGASWPAEAAARA